VLIGDLPEEYVCGEPSPVFPRLEKSGVVDSPA
jgi:hypothetical protein